MNPPPQNDFLPFATGPNALVRSQQAYAAAPSTQNGYSAGPLPPEDLNKPMRQATTMAYVLAQFIANTLGQNVLDNGNVAAIVAQLATALTSALEASQTFTAATVLPKGAFTGWFDCTKANILQPLPLISSLPDGTVYTLGKVDASANTLTLVPSGTNSFCGFSSVVLTMLGFTSRVKSNLALGQWMVL